MVTLRIDIDEQIAERLQTMAATEGRTVDELISGWVEEHAIDTQEKKGGHLEELIGFIKDDITDLSITAREELHRIFAEKHENTP